MGRRVGLYAAVVALWLGCNGKLLTITVEQSAETVVSPGTLLEQLVGDLGFSDFLDMDLTADSELQNQGVSPGDIQEVYLVSFALEATAPAGADLSFLEDMQLYVSAPGLPELLVASADAFPPGEPTVVFDLQDVDLTEYVVSQSMTLSTEVTGHRPDDETTVEALFAIEIGVTGQGACNALKKDE